MFTVKPESGSVVKGEQNILTAFAPAAVRYQWYKDGRPVNGATGPTLTIMHQEVGETHDYMVVAYRDDNNYTVSATAAIIAVNRGLDIRIR